MAGVSDPAVQRTVVRISLAAARTEGHLADGETLVLEAAQHYWRLVDGNEARARDIASPSCGLTHAA